MIGKASIKLDPLLTKREINETISLYDVSNPRKNIGASVQIILGLRTPVLKPEIVTKSKRWLKISAASEISLMVFEQQDDEINQLIQEFKE